MRYVIKQETLTPLIDEEISRVAAKAYEGEQSLYDSIVLHSNDEAEIERLIIDAVGIIIKRFKDYAYLGDIEDEEDYGFPAIYFEQTPENEPTALNELERYIVLNVVAAWFQDHFSERAQEFSERAQVALDKAAALIFTRKRPVR